MAGVVLLVACGGDGGDASTDATATGAAEQSAPAGGEGDFCTQAAGIDDRVEAAMSELDDGEASVSDAFRRLGEELRAIDAPEEIAADWDAMQQGLDRMADALAEADLTDPDSLGALEDAEGDLSTASDNVESYLRDECGIGG
ncbi:hypothetical protein [Geodermatophilus sp. URMC 64]